MSGNSSTGPAGGGGIANAGITDEQEELEGGIDVKNSIVGNSTAGGDCVNFGTFNASGDDFDTDGTCAALAGAFTQVTSGQLALGPLADNGGPTFTHALLTGSVAIDAAADCTLLDDTTPVTVDQRGVSRPQQAACDAGSFEVEGEGAGPSVVEVPTLGWPGGLVFLAALLGLGCWRLRQ